MTFFLLMDNGKPTTYLAFNQNEDKKELQSIIDETNKYWDEHENVRNSYHSNKLEFILDSLLGHKKHFQYFNFSDDNLLNI